MGELAKGEDVLKTATRMKSDRNSKPMESSMIWRAHKFRCIYKVSERVTRASMRAGALLLWMLCHATFVILHPHLQLLQLLLVKASCKDSQCV